MSSNTINIPPAADATISATNGADFCFEVSSTSGGCTVCFGTADPEGSFPDLENQTFNWAAGSSHCYPVPPDVGASLSYNTSGYATPCMVADPADTGKVIHVGSSMGSAKPQSTGMAKAKAKPAKKSAKVTAKSKAPAKAKAKSKAKPKAKAKAKAKARPKAKAKAKPKAKARPRTKAKAKAKAKKGAKRRR